MKLFFKIILFVGLTHVALSMEGGGGGNPLQPADVTSETTFNAETEKNHLVSATVYMSFLSLVVYEPNV